MSTDTKITVREACRRAMPLDGADAQALEGALSLTERERDKALRERDELLVERACVDESVASMRKGEEMVRAKAAEVAERGGAEALVRALTNAAGLYAIAADAWEKRPRLPRGLADEYAALKIEADALRKRVDSLTLERAFLPYWCEAMREFAAGTREVATREGGTNGDRLNALAGIVDGFIEKADALPPIPETLAVRCADAEAECDRLREWIAKAQGHIRLADKRLGLDALGIYVRGTGDSTYRLHCDDEAIADLIEGIDREFTDPAEARDAAVAAIEEADEEVKG
jgi:hypothetical protein